MYRIVAVLGLLSIGCSKASDAGLSIDEVPRYVGTNVTVSLPAGDAEGQSTVRIVDGPLARLVLYLRASSKSGSRDVVELNSSLPFSAEDFYRDGSRLRIKRSSALTFLDVTARSVPILRWTHRIVTDSAPESGADEVAPSGSLPDSPPMRPADADQYVENGGPGWVVATNLVVGSDRRVGGTLSVLPRSSIDFGAGTVNTSQMYSVTISGVVSIGCTLESEFASVEVGLENDFCRLFFSDFEGPLNP